MNFNPTGLGAVLLALRPIRLLSWLGPFATINPLRLIRLACAGATDHSEGQLAEFVCRQGPLVAIGRPGEQVTPGTPSPP